MLNEEKLRKELAKRESNVNKLSKSYFPKMIAYGGTDELLREADPKLHEQMREARNELKSYGDYLMSFPELFDTLKIWMVDVYGQANHEDNGEQIIANYFNGRSIEAAVTDQDGLCDYVFQFIDSHGFDITDTGGGCGMWHMGAYCTEQESRNLLRLMHEHFKEFLEEEALVLKRIYWGIEWPDVVPKLT